MAALLGPGFTITNHAQGYHASTIDELFEAAQGVAAWSDCEFLVQRAFEAADGTAVVVQGTLTNTHTGGTWRGIPPTGQRVSLSACYILGFDAEGRIVSQDIYEDHFTVFEQLGVVQLVDPGESHTAAPSGTVIIVSGAPGAGKSTVSRLVAAAFERSVRLQADDLMASVVSGWVDPNLPEAEPQNEAIGAALAVSAMSFAAAGYTTVVDGYLFPEGVAGLAQACASRGLSCHYVVLTADLDTCWARARNRGEGRWPLEFPPFVAVHGKFDDLDLDPRYVVEAIGSPESVCDAVLAAFRTGRLIAAEPPSS